MTISNWNTYDSLMSVLLSTDDFKMSGKNKTDALLIALMEEVGELAHEFKKIYKKGKTSPNKQLVMLEMGDILRILVLLLDRLSIDKEDFIETVLTKMENKYHD